MRRTLGVEDVHHGLDNVDAVLEAEVDEVGVDDDAVRRDEGLVVREEERGGHGITAVEEACQGRDRERHQDERDRRAYTRLTSFSFFSCSFFWAFSWFCFLCAARQGQSASESGTT